MGIIHICTFTHGFSLHQIGGKQTNRENNSCRSQTYCANHSEHIQTFKALLKMGISIAFQSRFSTQFSHNISVYQTHTIHTIYGPLLTNILFHFFFRFYLIFSYYFIPYSLIVNCRSDHLFPGLISDRKYTHILNPIKL